MLTCQSPATYLVGHSEIVLGELVVAVEDVDLNYDLDDVLHNLLRLLLTTSLQNEGVSLFSIK